MHLQVRIISPTGHEPPQTTDAVFHAEGCSIGRADSNDLVLTDQAVSRRHAVIRWSDGHFYIIDSSTNGTYLNGNLLATNTRHRVDDGDVLKVAEFVLSVTIGLSDHAPSVAPGPADTDSPLVLSAALPWRDPASSPAPALDGVDSRKNPQPVHLGLSHPQAVARTGAFTATFAAYAPELEDRVIEQLSNLSPRSTHHMDVKRCRWRTGAKITIELVTDGFIVEEPVQMFDWNGSHEYIFFDVEVPARCRLGSTPLRFNVHVAGFQITRLRADVEVVTTSSVAARPPIVTVCSSPATGFASYSRDDRLRVLDMIEAIEISAGLDVFLDCMDIKAGERWWPVIESEIVRRDLFLLFWSVSSCKSPWVEREWKVARSRKQDDAFQVYPLDPPEAAPTPAELRSLHFNAAQVFVRRGLSV